MLNNLYYMALAEQQKQTMEQMRKEKLDIEELEKKIKEIYDLNSQHKDNTENIAAGIGSINNSFYDPSICPCCGYCKHCGRRNNYPIYPGYPYFGQNLYGTQIITCNTASGSGGTL